jgi:hypothetical protein
MGAASNPPSTAHLRWSAHPGRGAGCAAGGACLLRAAPSAVALGPPHDVHLGVTADDPRQHARQRRTVARSVVLAVPPPGDPERGQLARRRASAIVRPAHGLHPVRHHRCGCAAELARATGPA